MSQSLSAVRRQLGQINSLLRQGKILPAVQALYSSLVAVLKQSLMKAERDEFERMFADSVQKLNADAHLRKIYPLALSFVPGEERALVADLSELLAMLQEQSLNEAEEAAAALQQKKTQALEEGQQLLDKEEHEKARSVFDSLVTHYPDDSDLKADMGERMLKAGQYEYAVGYLSAAVDQDPYVLHHYNRLGIALRKLGRFDTAESYYLKALPLAPDDPYLHFNVGRLYGEWGKWEKALEHGEQAVTLQPGFAEAGKLVAFARKKIQH